MTTSSENTIFISHASGDKAVAEEICRLMEAQGVPCWIAPRDVTPGRDYGEEIINAIEDTRGVLLIMSEKANESRHVRNEIERAVSKDKPVYPVFIEDVQPSKSLEFYISSSHWIPASPEPMAKKVAQLIDAMRGSPAAGDATPVTLKAKAESPALPAKRYGLLAAVVAIACLVAGSLLWARHTQRPGRAQEPATGGDAGTARSQDTATPLNYQALVIGISDYKNQGSAGWDDLVTARKDAEAVAEVLGQQYGFNVTTLLDEQATRDGIVAALDKMSSLSENDAALVYYAGHGYYDEDLDEGYWIPWDGRQPEGSRSAMGGWIWNSVITKIFGASDARHILVVADSCYSGSLFRGGVTPALNRQLQWYKRAFGTPSRYLITSGNLEPVLDSGGRHSVFAQHVLNYLSYPERSVFSASDLAQAVREQVSMLTGQLVRMGRLPLAAHAGGEFVFVQKDAGEAAKELAAATVEPLPGKEDPAAGTAPVKRQQRLQDTLLMTRQGATNSAQRLLAAVYDDGSGGRLADIVRDYLEADRRKERVSTLQNLIDRLEARNAEQGEGLAIGSDGSARPRILACLGPTPRSRGTNADSLAMLYRICLRAELEAGGGVQVVEREALEEVMSEMDLGTSNLADRRAQLEIGRLLPASMLLVGDLFAGDEGDRLFVRLVDTETTRVMKTFSAHDVSDESLADVCADLAGKISTAAAKQRPITARVTAVSGDRLDVGAGLFHGVSSSTRFELLRSEVPPAGGRGEVVGSATVAELGDTISTVSVVWDAEEGEAPRSELWVREVTP